MFLKPNVNRFPEASKAEPAAYQACAVATGPSVLAPTPVPYTVLTEQAAKAGEGVLEAV